MSGFISLEGLPEEPKDILTLNKIDFYWSKLPLLPKTDMGKLRMEQFMGNFYKKEKAKAQYFRQNEMVKNYKRLKKNMVKFARKGETNFFSTPQEESISLEPTPRIDLQQKYASKIYPTLMAVKEAEEIAFAKMSSKQSFDNLEKLNIRKAGFDLDL